MSETLLEEQAFKIGELETQVADLKNDKLRMVEELHEAVYGSSWARPESPQEVWEELIERVKRLEKYWVFNVQQ